MSAVPRLYPSPCEKRYRQLVHRLGPPLIRTILADFRARQTTVSAAALALGLSRSRFYELYSDYLRACAHRRQHSWSPGTSGGSRASAWPPTLELLLRKLLSARPPAPYRFAASEALRRLGLRMDPATVRRWAIANGLAHPKPLPRAHASVRRWQCLNVGALWQLDSTPHRWFPGDSKQYPLLDLLDDCSRVCTGALIYPSESLLAYLEFLPAAFLEHGLPLELYVDCHSLFFPQNSEALTQLGAALQFYEVSFRYARTPQAKGKIERQHQYWQGRLPALFAAEGITSIPAANVLLTELRRHRNKHEIHRELGRTPNRAAKTAEREHRTVLRPPPKCPWWPYVWSLRTSILVGPDGRVPVGAERFRIPAKPGTRVVHCQHPDGSVSVLAKKPAKTERPLLLLQARA